MAAMGEEAGDNVGGEWSTHGREKESWSVLRKSRRIIPYNLEYK
jgi:hypothetical protein